jgi:hypothetical protein
MKTRKDKAGRKKGQMRDLPKRKKDSTETQSKNVKGGAKYYSVEGGHAT